MSTIDRKPARSVLGFVPPEPLRAYAQVAVFADSGQAFEELVAILDDAGHEPEPHVIYVSSTGDPVTIVRWQEGEVRFDCHGPRGYTR